MAKFFMLGKYSKAAVQGMSSERTEKAIELIGKSKGKIDSMYVLLGGYDLALIVDLPDNAEAIKASVALTKLTDIAFTTLPAITVEEFDKMEG